MVASRGRRRCSETRRRHKKALSRKSYLKTEPQRKAMRKVDSEALDERRRVRQAAQTKYNESHRSRINAFTRQSKREKSQSRSTAVRELHKTQQRRIMQKRRAEATMVQYLLLTVAFYASTTVIPLILHEDFLKVDSRMLLDDLFTCGCALASINEV